MKEYECKCGIKMSGNNVTTVTWLDNYRAMKQNCTCEANQ
jgi:hypothetical protein